MKKRTRTKDEGAPAAEPRVCRVYRYDLGHCTQNMALVRQQMRTAHVYQNKLIEVERERRTKIRAAMSAIADVGEVEARVATALEALSAARGAIKAKRAEERRRAESPEMREAVSVAKANLAALKVELKAAKQRVKEDPGLKAAIADANEEAKRRRREERARSGLYWGTYLIVEAAVDQAAKGKMDPRFRRWSGNGAIAVQLQNGLPVEAALACKDARLQIERVPEGVYEMPRRGDRRRGVRTRVRVRVGSEGRKAVWAEWKFSLHRPLPPDARIKWARVTCRRISVDAPIGENWELHLTVEMPEGWKAPKRHGEGAVAVHVGWRKRPMGIRVGYWADERGKHGEFILPQTIIDRVELASKVRSGRDKALDEFRPVLWEWIRSFETEALPEWFATRTKTLVHWRSPQAFVALFRAWKDQRWTGDDLGFEMLGTWRYRDDHHHQWESNGRHRALLWRREIYRMFGAQLASRYETVLMGDSDYSKTAKTPAPESQDVQFEAAAANRVIASVGALRLTIKNAVGQRGGVFLEMSDLYVTRACHACGDVDKTWDAAADLSHTCEKCKTRWDQDLNGARNLLQAYLRGARKEEAA